MGADMAKPIKDTPILYGRDSDKFLKEVKKSETQRISKKAHQESLKVFKKIMANAKV